MKRKKLKTAQTKAMFIQFSFFLFYLFILFLWKGLNKGYITECGPTIWSPEYLLLPSSSKSQCSIANESSLESYQQFHLRTDQTYVKYCR